MAISTKNTVLAIVPETTEGTPVSPTSATQYVITQADLNFKPEFNVLQNAEVVASIGMRQPILGIEKPSLQFSHYVKHSGTEGTKPEWAPLLKSAFGTETVIGGSEEVLTSGSTVSVLNAASGHGANFSRGQGVLVKDGVNGYRIRVVESISTDALSLSFDLGGAPASGVKTGKAVFYSPAQTGHIALSVWRYLNQGGAVEMVSGARVTDINIKGTAGELINATIQLQGIQYYLDPVEITAATNDTIDWTDDAGTFAATVAPGIYRDPAALAAALQVVMNTATTKVFTITYDSTTGLFTVKCTGTLLSILFNTGTNTAKSIATKIGFTTAADKTGTAATTGYTSANAITFASPQTPTLDATQPIAAKNQEIMIGDHTDFACFGASEVSVQLQNTRTELKSICAATGISGSVFTARMAKVSAKAFLSKYDVTKLERFVNNTLTRFQWSFGNKTGGNWVAGQCGYAYVPTMSITKFAITNVNDLAVLEIEGQATVDAAGDGEVFFGFL